MAMAARMPMIATTISSSIRVKPFLFLILLSIVSSPFRSVAPCTIGSELRDGNGCQDADDRNNDQQLDQSEAFSVSDSVKHSVFSFQICSPVHDRKRTAGWQWLPGCR